MTAAQYLEQAIHLDEKIHADLLELDQLRRMAASLSSSTLKERVQTSPQYEAPFATTIQKLIDLQACVNDEIDRYIDLKAEIRRTIGSLEDWNEQMTLYYRYILNYSWTMIAAKLDASTKTVRRWHDRGLSHVIVPE